MKLALNSGIQKYQILTTDDEVCTSSILLALICTITEKKAIVFVQRF